MGVGVGWGVYSELALWYRYNGNMKKEPPQKEHFLKKPSFEKSCNYDCIRLCMSFKNWRLLKVFGDFSRTELSLKVMEFKKTWGAFFQAWKFG